MLMMLIVDDLVDDDFSDLGEIYYIINLDFGEIYYFDDFGEIYYFVCGKIYYVDYFSDFGEICYFDCGIFSIFMLW